MVWIQYKVFFDGDGLWRVITFQVYPSLIRFVNPYRFMLQYQFCLAICINNMHRYWCEVFNCTNIERGILKSMAGRNLHIFQFLTCQETALCVQQNWNDPSYLEKKAGFFAISSFVIVFPGKWRQYKKIKRSWPHCFNMLNHFSSFALHITICSFVTSKEPFLHRLPIFFCFFLLCHVHGLEGFHVIPCI